MWIHSETHMRHDTSKFKKIDEDSTLKREASLYHLLHKLKQKNLFNENEYNKLYPTGSTPACVYGTPKMHKFSSSDSFPEIRRIVSSICTFNYNLASFLCDLFSSLVPNDDTCRDTFSFVSQIKNAIFSRKFFVSYDVTSFSTNISLQETIDIVRDDIESIKSNFIKNGYPPFLIDKVMKKYLNYTFSSNQNQLKDTSDVHSSY